MPTPTPTSMSWRQTLAEALRLLQAGHLARAEPLLRQVLEMRPRDADALHALGVICLHTRRPDEAVNLLKQALEAKPQFVEAHGNLGAALLALERPDEAAAAFQTALRLQPNHAPLLCNYGTLLRTLGQLESAVTQFQRAIALRPNDPDAYFNLGNTLRDQGKIAEAKEAYGHALTHQPQYGEARHNLAFTLRDEGKLEESLVEFQRALACRPPFTRSLGGIAIVLADLGRIAESLPVFQQHLALHPEDAITHSAMVYAMQSAPGVTPEAIKDAHVAWAKRHAGNAAEPFAHANDPSPDRRLRIGYVSADFRQHSVAYFFENLLAFHDADRVETFCYSDVSAPDKITERLRSHAHHWRDTATLSHDLLSRQIRNDQVDILVDLSGHTAKNRLLTFAKRPAPLQFAYLGYVGTTGMAQIDYRLVDAYTDPAGLTDAFHTEQLIRLPRTFACYRPPDNAPPVGPLPALANGYVTFGCLCGVAKLHEAQLRSWANILTQTPHARILFVATAMSSPAVQARILSAFASKGIAAEHVEFMGAQSFDAYLRLHQRIDILLDTFPVNGHTITCHAAWMGVPAVSQSGVKYVSRLGRSVLFTLGMMNLLAESTADYENIAVALASDLPGLAKLRDTMRPRMSGSPLMDYREFSTDVESAYRECWTAWCSGASRTSLPPRLFPAH